MRFWTSLINVDDADPADPGFFIFLPLMSPDVVAASANSLKIGYAGTEMLYAAYPNLSLYKYVVRRNPSVWHAPILAPDTSPGGPDILFSGVDGPYPGITHIEETNEWVMTLNARNDVGTKYDCGQVAFDTASLPVNGSEKHIYTLHIYSEYDDRVYVVSDISAVNNAGYVISGFMFHEIDLNNY